MMCMEWLSSWMKVRANQVELHPYVTKRIKHLYLELGLLKNFASLISLFASHNQSCCSFVVVVVVVVVVDVCLLVRRMFDPSTHFFGCFRCHHHKREQTTKSHIKRTSGRVASPTTAKTRKMVVAKTTANNTTLTPADKGSPSSGGSGGGVPPPSVTVSSRIQKVQSAALSPSVTDQVPVGSAEILTTPHVSSGPGQIAHAPVPSVFVSVSPSFVCLLF